MLQNIKLGTKLSVSFILIALITAVVGYMGYNSMKDMREGQRIIGDVCLPGIHELGTIKVAQTAIMEQEYALSLRRISDIEVRKAFLNNIEKSWQVVDSVWLLYEALPHQESEIKLWKEFIPNWKKWQDADALVIRYAITKNELLAKGMTANSPEITGIDTDIFIALQKSQSLYQPAERTLNKVINGGIDKANSAKLEANSSSKSALNLMVCFMIAGIIISILFGILLTNSITRQLGGDPVYVMDITKKVADGDLSMKINLKGKKDTSLIFHMHKMMESIRMLVKDANTLSEAAIAGKLDKRADSSKHNGEYKTIIDGVNHTLDALIPPLNVTAEYVDRISKGDIPPIITNSYKGDFSEIKNNLNQLIGNLNNVINEMNKMSAQHDAGNIDAQIDISKFQGAFKEMAQSTNDMVKGHISVNKKAMKIVQDYADGNFESVMETLPGKKAFINRAIDGLRTNLMTVNEVVNKLVEDANQGKLGNRADSSKFKGDWAKLIVGLNTMLDSIIAPLNITAEYVDRISKGDVPSPITENYRGDFNEIKNNINRLINNLSNFISEMNAMSHNHDLGDIDLMMDASQFSGAYKNMVNGVNSMVGGHIAINKKAMKIVQEYADGNFFATMEQLPGKKAFINETLDAVRNNLISINKVVQNLILDATDGKLSNRGDASNFKGDWSNLIKGLNQMLDAVITPLKVTAQYVDRISKGDIPAAIDDNYKGDFNEIKRNLNILIGNLNNFTREMKTMSHLHDEGDIDAIIDIEKFAGAYKEMAIGVNNMATSHININRSAIEVFEQYGKGNFNANLKQLKGKQVFINNAIDSVRNNLLILVKEMKELIEKVKRGELKSRINTNSFAGDWKNMVNGLNEIVDSFVQPLNEAGNVLAVMATGDLTAQMVGDYNGSFGQLKTDIHQLGESLSDLISQVSETANNAASWAFQISTTAESLATATHEQSAQADEVASAVEEMSQTITGNAMSANRTSDVAKKSGEIAAEGGKVVSQTVDKMRDIAQVVGDSANSIVKLGESSKQIGEIISVIDDIADQTNLLALNAAIEAARAGEQGRGFAVVADEVRKLAERTTDATKRIATMIKSIQLETEQAVQAMNLGTNEVKSGIVLADKAGESLNEILVSSKEVLEMIDMIASASEEQSATSEQIAKNVTAISKVTGDSSKRVEEVALTSDELVKLTDSLMDILNKFTFNNHHHPTNKLLKESTKESLKLTSGFN